MTHIMNKYELCRFSKIPYRGEWKVPKIVSESISCYILLHRWPDFVSPFLQTFLQALFQKEIKLSEFFLHYVMHTHDNFNWIEKDLEKIWYRNRESIKFSAKRGWQNRIKMKLFHKNAKVWKSSKSYVTKKGAMIKPCP